MKIKFKDYFSGHAEDYKTYRPDYPQGLFAFVAAVTPDNKTAWDCATGTGQSALALTTFFDQVIATDASQAQLDNAEQNEIITYQLAPAENTAIDTRSIDLVTVAQALHWFDIPAFFKEVDRVLKPQGVLAVWTYNLLSIAPKIDEIVNHLYGVTLNDYWPKERVLLEENYSGIEFPFEKLDAPTFTMSMQWDFDQLLGYLTTWSAVKEYVKARGVNPVEEIQRTLAVNWGEPSQRLNVTWPLAVHVRRKP